MPTTVSDEHSRGLPHEGADGAIGANVFAYAIFTSDYGDNAMSIGTILLIILVIILLGGFSGFGGGPFYGTGYYGGGGLGLVLIIVLVLVLLGRL
jgi:hypothetical protein